MFASRTLDDCKQLQLWDNIEWYAKAGRSDTCVWSSEGARMARKSG